MTSPDDPRPDDTPDADAPDAEVRALASWLVAQGDPRLQEAIAQPVSELQHLFQVGTRLAQSLRPRNRIIARAGRHIGQKRRGSNGWGSL